MFRGRRTGTLAIALAAPILAAAIPAGPVPAGPPSPEDAAQAPEAAERPNTRDPVKPTGPAAAPRPAGRLVRAWNGWLDGLSIRRSALTVSYRGKIVRSVSRGRKARARVPIASLSKAITGACIGRLISKGSIGLNATLEEFYGRIVPNRKGFSTPSSARISIRQLLTHTSGLGPDSTQRNMVAWEGSSRPRHRLVSKMALGRKKQSGTPGRYAYNNENYAILGMVIADLTGQSYSAYCKSAVLAPFGAAGARLSPRFGAYGAWGGWEMSTGDFARFVAGNFGRNSALGKAPMRWARVRLGNGQYYYGMGTFFRPDGPNFWHFGRICFGWRRGVGAFFASWGRIGWSVVVAYERCTDRPAELTLDRILAAAAH